MSILDVIMHERRSAVEAARDETPIELLQSMASTRLHHSLKDRLSMEGTHIIAEMKKASPSAGLLQDEYDPGTIAQSYFKNGAVGISVLTEPLHFLGRGEDVQTVRALVDLPILRKDFMCDPYQIVESAAWGADVILLIAAALNDQKMRQLYDAALEQGLDVLAEVHTLDELKRVLPLSEVIVGVNSRDLKTLTTNLAVAHDLIQHIPESRLSIAESGIRQRAEVESLKVAGYNGFLIGEALVSHNDPGGRLKQLIG